MFNSNDVISCYSRKQAVEDGLQVCVSKLFPSDTRMYKFPVYFTSAVWELCQEQGAIVWDICYMGVLANKANQTDSSTVQYSVIVEGAERQPDFVEDGNNCYRLIAQCSATDIDDPRPCITFMFPEEH